MDIIIQDRDSMNTYVISSLRKNEKKAMRSLSPDLSSRQRFSTAPSTMSFDMRFSEDRDYTFVFSEEKVALHFSYLDEERFLDLHTVNILNLNRMEIMLSLVKGIGILGRGGPLKYISSEINLIIGSSLFDNSSVFDIREFSDGEMHWDNWNGDLLAITLELPDIKSISVEGRNVELKIRELELYPNESNKIAKIKAHNKNFDRNITIERSGEIRIALWSGEIGVHTFDEGTSFSTFSQKMIEFYEYVEEALGGFHEEPL